ncbi:MAG TPA: prolyl oligopeptidase family serine peptidase [Micropepsaceae bacterium]|nr:prolyl oligopeptidase family serine peptidase [Micropepsaceae bacterium]
MIYRAISILAVLIVGIALTGVKAVESDDPFLWLEDIHGARALDWVNGQNQITFDALKSGPDFAQDYQVLLQMLDADDRVPYSQLHGDVVLNFWQDKEHVRGIWRQTTVTSFESASPQWDILLDVDRLSADEGKNWVYKGAICSADLTRCLLKLSPDGGDTVVLREYAPLEKRFVPNGFSLGEAKAEAAYIDPDTILFSTDFGAGTLTKAGYPRIVKLWRRGQKIDEAKPVFEAKTDDVIASPAAYHSPYGAEAMVSRGVDYFETEYYSVTPDDGTIKIPLPLSAEIQGVMHAGAPDEQLLATLRSDWAPPGQGKIAQGSLIAFPLKSFLAKNRLPRVDVLYTPGTRSSIERVAIARDVVYASIYSNVTGAIHAFHRDPSGAWRDTELALPKGGSTDVISANGYAPGGYFSFEDFLTPATVYAEHDGQPAAIKSAPARFDAAPYAASQYEAVSKDGTRIPYFIVRAKNASRPGAMLLYGYGGFEISQTPFYWASMGRLWLSRGGAYAVANIRGGGEFGPAWHQAALKANRQKSYDDFIAVAEDMIRRGLTTPNQLGIMGGSNGGLLVGAVAVERPDLFGAVVCQVPLLDMIRYTKFGAGASWIAEYGDPDIPEERAAILRYSPYQNVRAGVKYPPFLFLTATSDDRVTPIHARKMAAKLEADGNEVLFFENTEGGHAAAADHAQQAEMNALTMVYLRQKLMPGG